MNHESINNYNEQLLQRSEQVLAQAVSIVSPDAPQAVALDVFPAPSSRRADDPGLLLSDDQAVQLRAVAAELGFGREADRSLSELGMFGATVYIEPGQPHKVVAEAQLVMEDAVAQPKTLVFGGSARRIDEASEWASAQHLRVSAATEYDMARKAAEQLKGFVALNADQPLPYGYDQDFTIVPEATGQLITIGHVDNTAIVLLRIDEALTVGGDKPSKPQTGDALAIVAGVLTASGDTQSPVALVTSATYQASREVDCARVSIEADRRVGCASYGTIRLAKVKGGSASVPAPINQLPGELHKLAKQVAKLRAVLYPTATEGA